VHTVGGIFHGVVEEIEDGGAEIFEVGVDVEADIAGDVGEGDVFRLQVVAEEDGGDAVGDKRVELKACALVDALALAELAGFEDGFDGGEEAIGVFAHDGVEALALGFVAGMTLEGFQVEVDAGDGGFELVGDGVEEGVLTLVAADFAKEEDGVDDDAGDEDAEEHDAEEIDGEARTVVVNPSDVEDDGEDDETDAERDEERFGSSAAGEIHG
jgi:hypothetical protein